MKIVQIIFVITLLVLFTYNCSIAQDSSKVVNNYPFYIGLASGLTTLTLTDVNKLFDDVVMVYKQAGFPIKIQRQNPGNIIFHLSASKDLSDVSTLGFRLQHTWTSSYALYSDAIGDLDLISKLSVSKFDVYYQLNLTDRFEPLLASLQFYSGFLSFNYNLTTESNVPLLPELNSKSRLYFNKIIPCFELLVFFKYKFGIVGLSTSAGFRIASTSKVYAHSSQDDIPYDEGEIDLDVNLTGLVCLVGLEIAL